ncbi:MAG: hypothetical protein LRY73_06070 [Bacillus sp. (in: Bacteria)]|nr:hypothetical protein [Bacillus sp. (in: firmicutes)]
MEANKNFIRPAHVELVIGEPVRIHQENTGLSIDQLASIVEERITTNLEEKSIKKTS